MLLLMFANLDVLVLGQAWWYLPWTVLVAATVVAILRARPWVGLVLAVVAALAAARPLLPMRLPQGLFSWAPAYGDWSTVARHLAPVLLLGLLSLPVLRRQLRARAWWWLLVPVAQVAVPVLVVVAARAAGGLGLASIGPARLERLGELGWTRGTIGTQAVLVAAALGWRWLPVTHARHRRDRAGGPRVGLGAGAACGVEPASEVVLAWDRRDRAAAGHRWSPRRSSPAHRALTICSIHGLHLPGGDPRVR